MGFAAQVGIYPDLSNEDYHLSDGVSKTSLCQIAKAPRVYRYNRDNPGRKKKTRSLATGSIFHVAMEGAFERDCAVGPAVDNKNKKEWTSFVAANPGKFCLTPMEAQQIFEMRKAMLANETAALYLSMPGDYEVSYYCIDEETGLWKKCRPDYRLVDHTMVLDFKTARDASEEQFRRDARNLNYHASAAMTIDIIQAITGVTPRYIFLAIEPQPPHLVACYEATAEDIAEGRAFVRRNLSLLRRCIDNGAWPGLPAEIRALDVGRLSRRYEPDPADEDDLDPQLGAEESQIREWWK